MLNNTLATIAGLPIQVESPGPSVGDVVELDVSAFWLARADKLQRKYAGDSSIFEMVNIEGKRVVCTYSQTQPIVVQENDFSEIDKIEAKAVFTVLSLSGIMSRANVTTLSNTVKAHLLSLATDYHELRVSLADPDLPSSAIFSLGAKYTSGTLFSTTKIQASINGVSFSGYVLSPDSYSVNYWLEGEYADVTINLHCMD